MRRFLLIESLLLALIIMQLSGCKGSSSNSQEVEETLNAPTDFKVQRVGKTSVLLTWVDNSNSESTFQIDRKAKSGDFVPRLFTAMNVTSAVDSVGLSTDTTYFYRITARRYSVASDYAPVDSIKLSLPYP